jgi:hypothetical protein
MQTINRGSNNSVVFTLTERVTLTNPYFLVRAQSRRTNQVKRFILANNQSSATERYDLFTITESTTEVLTSGTVTLTAGDWWYQIYEQASSSNLIETSAGTMLEEGILRVIDTTDSYITSDDTDTYVT